MLVLDFASCNWRNIIFGTGKMVTIAFSLLCLLGVILVLYLCWSSKTSSKELLSIPFQKSIYFQVTDDQGTQSAIHDSGQDPVLKDLRFHILKREINDRHATVLMSPSVIKYGFHPGNLDGTIQVRPEDIEDHGDYYIVSHNSDDRY